MSAAISISSLAQQCLEKFHEAMTGKNDAEHLDPLERTLIDFKLWVEKVGAMNKSRLFLDSRFQSRPDKLDWVKDILIYLSDDLDLYMDAVHKGLPTAEALAGIDSEIISLEMIGAEIHRTGKASGGHQVNQSFKPDKHGEFKRHLECLVLLRPSNDQPHPDGLGTSDMNELIDSMPSDSNEQNDVSEAKLEQLAKSRMGAIDSSRLNDIQRRLIDANLRRRHTFLLAREGCQHINRMVQSGMTANEAQADVALIPPEIEPTAQDKVLMPLDFENQSTKRHAPPTVTGHTAASTAEGTLQFNPAKHQPRAPTVACSQISFIAGNTEFPKPPLASQHQILFKCPCCCQSLPSVDFKNSSTWRQHLIEDLCPYTCIAQSCPTPDQLFMTREEWELHVKNDHLPQWQCILCGEDDEPFSSEEDISAHTLTQHKEALSKYGLSALLDMAKEWNMGIESCPLCSSYGPRDSPDIVDHAVRHAYEFALRALPWSYSVEEDLNKPIGTFSLPEDTSNREQLEKWLDSVPCSAEKPAIHVSSFDEMDHALQEKEYDSRTDDYFTKNDYFEDEEWEGASNSQAAQTQSFILLDESSGRDSANQDDGDDVMQAETDLNAAATRGDEGVVRSPIENPQGGHISIIKQLLGSGVDINSQEEYGRTALFFAVERDDISLVQYLVQLGIDADTKGHDGLTALQLAIQKDNKEIICAVFTLNVYLTLKNQGQEAILWAQENRHRTVAQILRDLRDDYEFLLSQAQEIFNINDRTAAARSIIQCNSWYSLINPVLEPVFFDIVGILAHKDRLLCVGFSHDGKHIAAGSSNGSVKIFDFETRRNVCEVKLGEGDSSVYSVCFSPDGRFMVAGGKKLAQVWDIEKKSVKHFLEHEGVCDTLVTSNDGRVLASSDRGCAVHIWDLEKGVKIQKFTTSKDPITTIHISPDNCFVAAGTNLGNIFIWRLKTNTLERRLHHGQIVMSLVFSSDSKHLVSGGDPLFKSWELDTGTCLSSDFGLRRPRIVSGSMTPDDKWVILVPDDRSYSVQFWDRTTGKGHSIFHAHCATIRSAACRPQGDCFATASDDSTVRIWSYSPRRKP